jgi:L-asparaginase
MTKPKIAIIFTGGTISMRSSKKSGGAVPAFRGRDILKLLPVINKNFKIDVHDFGQFPGPHITPEMMLEISSIAQKYLAKADIKGVIVTHGTDTLEETAYFLDLTIKSAKPVVVVGAMKDCTELGWDGPANLMGAARTAVSPDAGNKGVLVFLNNTINSAGEVTKTSTDSFETFRSPDLGPLGWVDQDRVLFYRQPMYREHYPVRRIEPRVDLFKMAVGMDSRLLKYAVDSGARGLVVEGMGRGNIPPAVVPGIEYAIGKKIPVILCSRCIGGRVLGTYAYPGGGAQLIKKGVILGGHLPGQKARIKLMILLGRGMDPMQIKELFERFEYSCGK